MTLRSYQCRIGELISIYIMGKPSITSFIAEAILLRQILYSSALRHCLYCHCLVCVPVEFWMLPFQSGSLIALLGKQQNKSLGPWIHVDGDQGSKLLLLAIWLLCSFQASVSDSPFSLTLI